MVAPRRPEIVKNGHESSCARTESSEISSGISKWLKTASLDIRYRRGEILFVEGQPSRGVFIVRAGRVKLFTTCAEGERVGLRIARPGEILGLAATLSGQTCEAWAEAVEPTQVLFVETNRFVDALRRHHLLAVYVAMRMAEDYCSANAEVRASEVSHFANQKLATFLLGG